MLHRLSDPPTCDPLQTNLRLSRRTELLQSATKPHPNDRQPVRGADKTCASFAQRSLITRSGLSLHVASASANTTEVAAEALYPDLVHLSGHAISAI